MIKENQSVLNRLLIFIDAVIIGGSFVLAYLIKFYIFRPAPGVGVLPLISYVHLMPFVVGGYILVYLLSNVYTPKRTSTLFMEIMVLLRTDVICIALLVIVIYVIMHAVYYARSVIGIFFILSFCVEAFFRIIIRTIIRRFRLNGYNAKHVLLVGYSRAAESYISKVVSNPEWGYIVFGILDNWVPVGTKYYENSVIGRLDELENLIKNNDFDEVVITLSLRDYDYFEQVVNICEKNGVHTKFIPDYNSVVPTNPYTEDLDGLSVINIRRVPLSNAGNQLIKRAVDIAGSLFAIIITSPVMLVTAFLVKVSSKGPILFKQERVGYQGKTFKMLKFRSMVVQSEAEEKRGWTVKGDPRVTPVGRIMRKTSIDELPQFFNILKGDMSLVGPRPERPQYVEKFREEIPRYMVKHQVRPGLTGWAQVNGLRGDTSIKKRIDHDIYYIENWTFFFDLKILFMTLFVGFMNKNAY
ncbi:MAG: undecaprenyl-phosphate glucose phosphotransferase [Lachnospiraceae bacterium]|nr:undecaprenyl-phosphate glucose phosphotransferase [Lachnospiraceae bacterium]